MTPRLLTKSALIIALPLFAAPALAQDEKPAEPAPTEEKVEEEKICKRVALQMGSRRKTKVCMTKAEWKTYNEELRGRSRRN